MRPVQREELLDYVTYGEQRDAIRRSAMETKRVRRVHVGAHLTLLFENRETVRYQVLEMMRAEHIVKEAEIRHELATYNELLGGPGELGCTLLIEIEEAKDRPAKLAAWRGLPGHLYARLPDGSQVRAVFDERQMDDRRLSAVQFIKFPVGAAAPVAIGVDLPGGADAPGLEAETALSEEQRAALAADLAAE